jgi:hypothetical protein
MATETEAVSLRGKKAEIGVIEEAISHMMPLGLCGTT